MVLKSLYAYYKLTITFICMGSANIKFDKAVILSWYDR